MFGVFASFISSQNRPIILLPPMFGSVLHGKITNLKSHWYCKKNYDDAWIWITERFLVPPTTNCLAQYLKVTYDPTTKLPVSRPESDIFTIDFGGDKAIRYLDKGLLGKHFIPSLADVLNKFVDNGYTIREDMFGAPYDWRMNPVSLDQFFKDFKQLVEDAYTKNKNTPICAFGFSAGCMALHAFLTAHCTKEWKDKYFDRIILMGPSYAGSPDSIEVFWEGKITFLPSIFDSKDVEEMALSIPTLYSHLPNVDVYGDRPVVEGPNGEIFKAADMYDFFSSHDKVHGDNVGIYQSNLPLITRKIEDPDVDVYFIFNSILETRSHIKFADGYDKMYTKINGTGDTTITSFGLYFGCNNWNSPHTRICHDLQMTDGKKYNHASQIAQPDVAQIIFEATTRDDWKKHVGSYNITGNTTAGWGDL